MSEHKAVVVKDSVKRTEHGGIAMVLRCCDGGQSLDRSVHHEGPGLLTAEERKQWVERHLAELEAHHAAIDVALAEFKQYEAGEPTVKKDSACESCGKKW